jgi:hypothetical protein
MSYGAASQLLRNGMIDPNELLEAMKQWPDEVQRCHAEIAVRAFEFARLNSQYIDAQQKAVDLLTATSQARIYLHNAIVAWQSSLEKATKVDAVDPVAGNTTV